MAQVFSPDVILAERRLVALQTQVSQPICDIHEPVPPASGDAREGGIAEVALDLSRNTAADRRCDQCARSMADGAAAHNDELTERNKRGVLASGPMPTLTTQALAHGSTKSKANGKIWRLFPSDFIH